MNKPILIEKFADNGAHSHWELIDSNSGETLWIEKDPDDEEIIIEGYKFRRGDIYDIYWIERDKKMFLNREAGFIVQILGDKDNKYKLFVFGEDIPYDSYSHEIYTKRNKWEKRMHEAIVLWRNDKDKNL